MTHDPESRLFDFAASKREPETEDEMILTELHSAIGTGSVPLRLRRPPTLAPSPRWRGYIYTAVTFALVVAVATAGIFALREQTGSPPPTDVPEVVLGLASPDSTSTDTATCDFTGDVPLFVGLEEAPLDGPSVLLSPSNELTLECNGVSSLLLEDVQVTGIATAPHVLVAMTSEASYFINIVTEEQIRIPLVERPQLRISEPSSFPWMISASTADPTTASIYNLSSMTEFPIVDEDGHGIEFSKANDAPVSGTANHFAIAVPSDDGLAGFFVADSGGDASIVSAPSSDIPQNITISPNGETLATSTHTSTGLTGETEIALVSLDDGSKIASFPLKTRFDTTEMQWLADGSMLMLTDGNGLYGIHADSPGDGMQVFFEGQFVQGLILTPDTDVVVVSHASDDEEASVAAETRIVNVRTGESLALPGHDMFSGLGPGKPRAALVMVSDTQVDGVVKTLTVVDATTGETVGEIADPPVFTDADSNTLWGISDTNVTHIAFGAHSMWRIVDENGNATLEKVSPPADLVPTEDVLPAYIRISPDGYLVLHTFEPTQNWLKTPHSSDWIEIRPADGVYGTNVPPNVYVIPGTD